MRSTLPGRPSAIPTTAGWIPGTAARLTGAQLAALAWIAATLGCFLWNLGASPLFDVDEGAFGEATREMLARRDFLTTYLNGQLRFDKPILVYWLQAASVRTFGLGEFALRLPSALAASAWLLIVLRFVRRLDGDGSAIVAMMLLATAAGPLLIARAATADALLHLCLAGTLVAIHGHATTGQRRFVLQAFAWMAAGTLAKGPIAVLIPLLASALTYFSTRRAGEWARALGDPVGWAIFLAIAGPWYALEFAEQGEAFVRGFFLRHNVERFSAPLQGHGGAWFYYAPALLLVLLPHTGLFLRILPTFRAAWADAGERLLWAWFLVVLVVFSVAGTKLPHYILYGCTPLFILMARHRGLLRSRALAYGPALAWIATLLLLPLAIAHWLPSIRNVDVAQALSAGMGEFDRGYVAALALAFLAVAALAWKGPRDLGVGLVLAGCVTTFAIVGAVVPALSRIQQGPVVAAASFVKGRPEPVVAWGINVPSFSVYRQAVTPTRRPQPGDLVLTRVDKLAEMPPHEVVFARGAVRIVKAKESP
jgi:4-amino-4-deoxy-L-arabinose transferase-like glycosyltransferase